MPEVTRLTAYLSKLSKASNKTREKNYNHMTATLGSTERAYFNVKSSLALSLAIFPSLIKLIKSAIYFSLSLLCCVLTLGRNVNLNNIAYNQFLNTFINIGNIFLSLIVPFCRLYQSYKSGLEQYSKEFNYEYKRFALLYEKEKIKHTWGTVAELIFSDDDNNEECIRSNKTY